MAEAVMDIVQALAAHIIHFCMFATGCPDTPEESEPGPFTGDAPMENVFDCDYLSFATLSLLIF